MIEAFREIAGIEISPNRKDLSGKTDVEIINDLLALNQKSVSNLLVQRILDTYTDILDCRLSISPPSVIGGVLLALAEIASMTQYRNCVVTGNCQSGANIKLRHADLLKFFSCDHIFTSSIERAARHEILEKAIKFVGNFAIVIGDSPSDILAARKFDLVSVAVLTGQHSQEELAQYKPSYLLSSDWSVSELFEILREISV